MSDIKTTATEPDPAATSIAPTTAADAEMSGVTATEADKAETADKANGAENKDAATGEPKDAEMGGVDATKADDSEKKDSAAGDAKRVGFKGPKAPVKVPRAMNKSKYDPKILPESSNPDEIRAQVEFYFGDNNFRNDAHMWELTEGAENKPVPIKHVATFGRMQHFKPYSAIVEALKSSQRLVVSGSEGEEMVGRKYPYKIAKGATREDFRKRTVYIKGFGEETPSSQFDIEAWLAPHCTPAATRLRRDQATKEFKGSVYVEFDTEAQANAFLELDPKPKWNGQDLIIMSKKQYCDEKDEGIRNGTVKPNLSKTEPHQRGGGFRGRGGRKGDGDSNDWKKRRDEDQKNGHRGGGRGGRGGGGRGGRGGKNNRNNRNDRNQEKKDAKKAEKKDSGAETKDKSEAAESSKPAENKVEATTSSSPKTGNKRSREDDGAAASEQPAKKVDTKEAAPATES